MKKLDLEKNKRQVSEELMKVHYIDFKDLREKLNELYVTYGNEIHVDIDYDTGYYESREAYIRLYRNRLETDEEYNDRIQKETQAKENRQNSDRALYERLKKQFGN